MNIIKTVGDIKKTLSVYGDALPFEFCVSMKNGGVVWASNNNDTMFAKDCDADDGGAERLFVMLVEK